MFVHQLYIIMVLTIVLDYGYVTCTCAFSDIY